MISIRNNSKIVQHLFGHVSFRILLYIKIPAYVHSTEHGFIFPFALVCNGFFMSNHYFLFDSIAQKIQHVGLISFVPIYSMDSILLVVPWIWLALNTFYQLTDIRFIRISMHLSIRTVFDFIDEHATIDEEQQKNERRPRYGYDSRVDH